MKIRLLAWVKDTEEERVGIHFQGLPQELAGVQEQRELLPWPRLLLIEEKPDGIFLVRFNSDGRCVGDTWHQTIEDAKHQANSEYSGLLTEWSDVPEDISDPVKDALKSSR